MRLRQRCPLFGFTYDRHILHGNWAGKPAGPLRFQPRHEKKMSSTARKLAGSPSKLAICLGNSRFCSTCNLNALGDALAAVPAAPGKCGLYLTQWAGSASVLKRLHHVNYCNATLFCAMTKSPRQLWRKQPQKRKGRDVNFHLPHATFAVGGHSRPSDGDHLQWNGPQHGT